MAKSIRQIIQNVNQNGDEIYCKIGIVTEIDTQNKTVVVEPIDGSTPVLDVKIQADVSKQGLAIFPAIGSHVLIGFIDKDNAVLLNSSEVTKFDLAIEKTQFKIDAAGFLLKKENETLKKLMVDLLQAIQNMKFTTNTGSTILLVNKPEFVSIEKRFNQFLKDS